MSVRRRTQAEAPSSPGPLTRSKARALGVEVASATVGSRSPPVGLSDSGCSEFGSDYEGGESLTSFSEAASEEAAGHDGRSVALLMVLYTLQGVPMGLSGAVPLLLAGKTSYKMQSLFSLASFPFSLKLLWAPFVDAAYVPAWGRRKTWLVPVQLGIGLMMVSSKSWIESWMADGTDGEPDVEKLTAFFFSLYFLYAAGSEKGAERSHTFQRLSPYLSSEALQVSPYSQRVHLELTVRVGDALGVIISRLQSLEGWMPFS